MHIIKYISVEQKFNYLVFYLFLQTINFKVEIKNHLLQHKNVHAQGR